MITKLRVELGPVQETLLIPLLGRAEETRKTSGLLRDTKAVEIVESLDYDFAKWRGARSLVGASIRARMFDEEVSRFLAQHRGGTVVEIGVGLNTRYERLDDGCTRWLELDLPDSMRLRHQFFAETERRSMIAASVLDEDWLDRLDRLPPPYFFVAEAVLIYLERERVEPMLERLARRFPGAWLLTDTTSSRMVDGQAEHDAMSKLPKDAWFRWRCDAPADLRRLGLRLERTRTFAEAPPDVVAAMPLPYRLARALVPGLFRRQVEGYRINRFRFAEGPSA